MWHPGNFIYKTLQRKLHLAQYVIVSLLYQQNEITSTKSFYVSIGGFLNCSMDRERDCGRMSKAMKRGTSQGQPKALTQGHTGLTANCAPFKVHSERKAKD